MYFPVSATALLAFIGAVAAQTTGFDAISAPAKGESVPAGSSYTITWTALAKDTGTVTIQLLQGKDMLTLQLGDIIAAGVNNLDNKYSWAVSPNLGTLPTYGIKISLDSDPTTFQYSNPFSIAAGKSSGSASSTTSSSQSSSLTASGLTSSGTATVTVIKVTTSTSASVATETTSSGGASSTGTGGSSGSSTGSSSSISGSSSSASGSGTGLTTVTTATSTSAGGSTASGTKTSATGTGTATSTTTVTGGTAAGVLGNIVAAGGVAAAVVAILA